MIVACNCFTAREVLRSRTGKDDGLPLSVEGKSGHGFPKLCRNDGITSEEEERAAKEGADDSVTTG